ncbi:MAG TPA: CHAD domain-containing protein [Thermoanaerobaculia bacterium]|nr:CHAD domain-containing protein [Thermoanaerobaculia bacterium]
MEVPRRRLAALTAALTKRRSTLEALLAGGAGAPSGERLHAVRVALRRTVSLARLTQDVPAKGSGARLKTAARDLRRALGARRTHDVAAALLRARFRRDPRRRPAAARLAARLDRDAGAAASPERIDALLAGVRREFAARDSVLASLAAPLADLDGGRLERRLEKAIRLRLGRRARRLLERGVPEEGNVHEARIDARDLRYGLEFARLPGSTRLLPLLERFQEAAGRAHDRAEVIALVRKTAGALQASRRREALRLLPPLLRDAERELSRVQAASRSLLAALKTAVGRW